MSGSAGLQPAGPASGELPASPRTRLARGSLWTVAGVGIQTGAGMLASIALARILGPVAFGELGIARSTLAMFSFLAGASLGVATSRSVADARADPERAGRVLGLLFNVCFAAGGIATVLCLVLASPIAKHLGAPQLTVAIAASAIVIAAGAISTVQLGALQGFERFESASRLLAAEGVLNALLLAGGAWVGGVTGAMLGFVAATAVMLVPKMWALSRLGVTIRYRGLEREMPILRDIVLPAIILGFATQPFEWLACVLLARGTNGLAQVGVFSAAYSWGAAVMFVPMQVARPAMPILTSLRAAGDASAFRRLLRDALVTVLIASIAVAIPLMLLSPWIMRAYGRAFAGGAMVLTLIAAASVFGAISWLLRAALIATGNVWQQTMLSLVWGVSLLIAFLALRPYGALALAGAYVIASIVAVLVQASMTRLALR